jgi:hypothetical protein
MKKDFLDEMVGEATTRNAEFPALLDEAARRRAFARELAAERQAAGTASPLPADSEYALTPGRAAS